MEADWFKLNGICRDGELPIVVCLSFRRRYIAEGFKQAVVIEPRHPFEVAISTASMVFQGHGGELAPLCKGH